MILDKGCSSLRSYTAGTEVQLHVFEPGLNVRYHAPSGARLIRTICDIESLLLTTGTRHYTNDCNTKIKQDGTRTPCDYANSPHHLLPHADLFVFTAATAQPLSPESCMQPRIWSLGRAEDIRVQSNGRCRRAENPEDIERRRLNLRQKECLRRLKPTTSRGAKDQRASKKVTPVFAYPYNPLLIA
ncbi:hypothetical protein T12_11698 [Trichinella patagoniensis]|uniref:Uncharacterized protein n=1 Tax=Trichinella patagoniensis TaxID=990121 RepID=A0A0V0Z134_9BILA|nr:hypothetical protein T12_11698 [Trichinella patagoniensis]